MRRLLIAILAGMAFFGLASAGTSATGTPWTETASTTSPSTVPTDPSAATDAPGTLGATDGEATEPYVDVLQVDGFFDEILVGEVSAAIDRADQDGSQALILQINSAGAVVSKKEMAGLMDKIAASPVPVAIWVGPTGAKLYGAPAQLLAVADVSGMAPGAHVGNIGGPVDYELQLSPGLLELRYRIVGLSEARELGVFRQRISDEGIPIIKNMLEALDGYEKNGVVLNTTEERTTDAGVVQRTTVAAPRFFKLPLIDQLFHTVASAPVAYLLFLIGMSLLIFEFFTAGIGIAGVVGAGSLILACYGLAALPARWWAVGLLVLGMIAFTIDVQVGIPRAWTGMGMALVIAGSFWLYEPVSNIELRPTWMALIVGIGGTALTYIVGMPSMTRTRFATPTIGREWMIGAEGFAVGTIDPEGVVRVNNANWKARTNRATPLQPGDSLRVAAIDGIVLQVEPLEGAARDYREMRKKPGDSGSHAALNPDDLASASESD